jgi:flavin-binding protein dodecin
MDTLLKLAADAGHEVSTAEEAVEDGAHDAARDALDRASDTLAELRERWADMSSAERAIVGPAAKSVRERLDAVAARLPVRRTLSEGAAEADPEEEAEPEA